jgi:hypothetical protein
LLAGTGQTVALTGTIEKRSFEEQAKSLNSDWRKREL